ncbi:MAG: bifunctional (p)ppGpp synthetase/guanosine-3',5'-bis(diphosphate) 3'-pyrophosphohydrolase [Rickettsiaceae bacterium]|nr:bifunctional (p)ppGpp synthetase/guanosine-3',5'-bis(diphosphate) 3'-pyrophosphohydrolase [Rickettsiaceae bacterium]
MVDYQEIINKYKSYDINFNEELVSKAIEFAVKYHGSQIRESGEPYYNHPIAVGEIIAQMCLDTDSIVTALLHDTIEDTKLTYDDIKEHFGLEVANLVEGVTKLTKIEFIPENVRQAENFRKLLLAMSDDIRVLLVKLADRLHNMRTISFVKSEEKRKRKALETMEIYAPLAERIGIQQIKTELQDICFRVLYPKARESILNRFKNIATDKDHLVEQVVGEIQSKLQENNIKATVYGRRKTPYSTWMKMKQKNVGIDQLSDIIAFRIIVEKVEECYQALGVIHRVYKMVPGNFQDFISIPKSNGYQSLHTVVIGPLLQKIEIQIRTIQMHNIAELGVAAHWRYKQGDPDSSQCSEYAWIRELLSIVEYQNDPEESLKNTKLAMYYNQVFCFTPKGNLVALPKGATVIDFAYMVHTDIGNCCMGAKVNGCEVGIDTKLVNGDQVEILTDKVKTVAPFWENIIVTGKARSEIHKTLQVERRKQYIKLGDNIISKALKNIGITNKDEALVKVCNFLKKDKDSLLLAIGNGSLTREEIVKHVTPKKGRLSSTLSLLNFNRRKKTILQQENDAIPIKGLISGMAMHFAKCCYPLPGDNIVGIINKGDGVNIHTAECDVLNSFKTTPEKIINVTWDSNKANIPFICKIKISLINKPGSLAILTSEIAGDGANVINFKLDSRNQDLFEMTFYIEVLSLVHAKKIINNLRTKEVIHQIERVHNN